MAPSPCFFTPDWPAPASVKAAISLREGGVSSAPYESFNLAEHVGDTPESVAYNRLLLAKELGVENICWMQQVHGTGLVRADSKEVKKGHSNPTADACWTDEAGQPCAVLTADCLPLLVCDVQGSRVAALHAGWRGLANGVISQTLRKLGIEREETLVWFGPAISPAAYEVGAEVRNAFAESSFFEYLDLESAFKPDKPGHYLCDLYQLARLELSSLGVTRVFGGDQCTYRQQERYFSYRRDGQTGRMASLIWLE